jgi:trimeric autotransporter adhesin
MTRLIQTLAVLLGAAATLAAREHHGVVTFRGLPVPGATATAIDEEGRKQSTVTNADGVYAFPDLAGESWTIRVEMQCFETIEKRLAAGTTANWEISLAPVANIPVQDLARQAQDFQTADVKRSASPAEVSAGSMPSAAPVSDQDAADLTDSAADSFLVNGTANNGASTPFAISPAFGNFRKGPGSLYNASLGAIIGSAALDARPYSLTGVDTPKPDYRRMTGLFAFGGPLRIPHLLRNGPNLLVDYQWTRNRDASTLSGLVPTEAERRGDLGPRGQIAPSLISREAQRLLTLYPLPNVASNSRFNYQVPRTGATHQDSLQARANKPVGRRDQVFSNLSFQSTRTDNTNLFGFLDTTETTGLNTALDWRHALTPRLSITLGTQFSRLDARVRPYFAGQTNVSALAGIYGNNQDAENWGPPSLNFTAGIAPLSDANASHTRNQTTGFSGSGFSGRGRHGLSFGADLRRQQFNLLEQQEPRGTFTFTGETAGSDFAAFLLGVPDTASVAYGNADKYFRAWFNDAYVADDWRVSPGFSFNAGVRWEYGSPITELYGRLVNLDTAGGFAAAAPVLATDALGPVTGRAYAPSLVDPDRTAVQPRIGFSWRLFEASSMVVRGGYGVYYDTSGYQRMATQMAQQPPFSKALRVQNSPETPLTLATALAITPPSLANTFGVDPSFQIGYAQNWLLSVQRDLPGALVMVATYSGNKGTRGAQAFLPNTSPAGAPDPCVSCPRGFTYLASNGNSHRNAGQIELRRRMRAGLTGSVRYTLAKAIDDATLGGRSQVAPAPAQNWLNLRGERGRSPFDQRHAVMAQVQYTTGMSTRGGMFAGRWGSLLREWTLASQITAGTGLPLTPVYPAAVEGTGVAGSIRPDYTGAPLYDAPPGSFLNPAAYRAPALGHWGNAGRNSINGPGQFVMSSSLGRTFRRGDRLNLDFRVDASNTLNQVTYTAWNTVAGSAQFGFPTSGNPMRTLQTVVRARF